MNADKLFASNNGLCKWYRRSVVFCYPLIFSGCLFICAYRWNHSGNKSIYDSLYHSWTKFLPLQTLKTKLLRGHFSQKLNIWRKVSIFNSSWTQTTISGILLRFMTNTLLKDVNQASHESTKIANADIKTLENVLITIFILDFHDKQSKSDFSTRSKLGPNMYFLREQSIFKFHFILCWFWIDG